MEKTIKIGTQEVTMRATANTPKRYRHEFNADLLLELNKLYKQTNKETGAINDGTDLSVIENLAYIMAKQADPTIGTQDDWLDQFEPLDIYEAMREIMSIWTASTQTTATSKKG